MVVETGVAGLKVQALAASLGATTGSLYWHFEDRRALELALAEHWAHRSTEPIVRHVQGLDAPPDEKLLKLLRLILENFETSGDIAIRSWAAHDAEAARVVARVDARRAEYATSLFREMGFRGDDLQMRVQMLLCYESCERFVAPDMPIAKRRRLLRARHRLYCS